MGKIEEIISKYADSPERITEFGPWLVSGKNTAEKEKALATLWSKMESSLVADSIIERKAKLATIMAGLEGGYSKGRNRFGTIARWSLTAIAAAIAIFLLIKRPGRDDSISSPGEKVLLSGSVTTDKGQIPPFEKELSVIETKRITVSPVMKQVSTPAPPSFPESNAPDATAMEDTHAKSFAHSQDKPAQLDTEHDTIPETVNKSGRRSTSISFYGSGNLISSSYSSSVGYGAGDFLAGSSPGSSVTYDAPLNFGISLSFPLTGKLSFESGLAYSYLHSSISDLHYAGIPFYLSYNIYSGGNIGFYTSAGGSVLYCIHGGGQEHPLQAAATISCGLEYMLSPKWSIFGEGSMNHYFKDGSPLITYYSEHPNAFVAKAGIRFKLNQ